MKNSIKSNVALALMSMSAGVAVLLSGCATTPETHSYNQDFGENLVTNPKYYIKDADDKHFLIVVNQGSPTTSAARVSDVKTAATGVARSETKRLGWEKWDLNYIQEKDQGWMHVVIAEVKPQPAAASTSR